MLGWFETRQDRHLGNVAKPDQGEADFFALWLEVPVDLPEEEV